MQGLWDIIDSERGIAFILLMLLSFALCLAGKMTIDQWIAFAQIIGGIFIGSKTVTSAIEAMKKPNTAPAPTPAPTPPATPPAP